MQQSNCGLRSAEPSPEPRGKEQPAEEAPGVTPGEPPGDAPGKHPGEAAGVAEAEAAEEAEDPAQAELRTWLTTHAKIKRGRVPWVLASLRERRVESVKSLRRNLNDLEQHLPAAAFNMISRAIAADAEAAAEARRAREAAALAARGLKVKYIGWSDGRSAETTLPFVELHAFESVGKLVGDLAKRGNALLNTGAAVCHPADGDTSGGTEGGGGGGSKGLAMAIRPSTMRIEYKMVDKKTGVMQRVMLTPQSQVADLQRAESILVRPHDD